MAVTLARSLGAEGFVVVQGHLRGDELSAAIDWERRVEGHSSSIRRRLHRNPFGGIEQFPFDDAELSRLAVHERIIDLACEALGTDEIRLYRAESWVKVAGSASYEQEHHRDYPNHSLVVPSQDASFGQLEMFVYLSDIDQSLGPTAVVPKSFCGSLPATDWTFPRLRYPELYEAEVRIECGRGSVLLYTPDTVHRGTDLTCDRGSRYSLHLNFRTVAAEWAMRTGWADVAIRPAWSTFVSHASPRQLSLFGFPAPGSLYWTPDTLRRVQERYSTLDMTAWM